MQALLLTLGEIYIKPFVNLYPNLNYTTTDLLNCFSSPVPLLGLLQSLDLRLEYVHPELG